MHETATSPRAANDMLAARLEIIRARCPDIDPVMIANVVRAILATMSGDLSSKETALLCEVEELGRTIAAAKAEIAAIRADDITGQHIPSATDELDAIVSHTASATNAILEVCETLDQVGATLQGQTSTQLREATARIYEACSFQGITGQRITKVVGALKAIETKVAQIVAAFGPVDRILFDGSDEPGSAHPEAALLNGPQLATTAMEQSEIDRLLASL
jgi:chemotaxis protein CheZ